ncbi:MULTISPECIES: response regulator [Sphingomonadales]|uniref:Transcriptional regulatory protein LiaR n=1 Tax=Edaphosphingomonas haloaromaticamans TaxID=653954 RepID=A0A1S1H964_9SPHN|nr:MULTISPECIES: response regulator transcription factor [Sphingomonas]AGH50306.1 two-component response regulator [Sphingomonas sp. MM-1]OHT18647.1 Transcriptional regulatory protein LiaR [Sphingomonas haloaromaticamans]
MGPPQRRILIADDHEVLRRGVRTFVENRPDWIVVGEAADGQSALDLALECKPDIAIVDYLLPILNGLDLTRRLKRELPRVEVLIYTMHDREDLILEVLRAGARGYVLKSDTGGHLLGAIEALSVHKPYFSGAISETLLDRFLEADQSASGTTLTQREREVVQLIAEGRTNKEIGHALHISVKTVETHRASSMHKLKLKTTAELVRYAVRNNIVQA